MPERADHQASGLASLQRQRGTRLAAMVSHGDLASELPLLWRLCLTWVELGYPVTVLDAGTCESEDNPGLEQLLDFPTMPLAPHQDATAWNVIPSAIGLQTLVSPHPSPIDLERLLAGIFPDDGIVVVYGSAGLLTQLLANHALQPLMAVSSAQTSLLTGYQALKRLLRVPGLSPVVIDHCGPTPLDTARQPSAANTLANCARNFLSLELTVVHLQTPLDSAPTATDYQSLALRILENALALHGRWMLATPTGAKMDTRQFSRSH